MKGVLYYKDFDLHLINTDSGDAFWGGVDGSASSEVAGNPAPISQGDVSVLAAINTFGNPNFCIQDSYKKPNVKNANGWCLLEIKDSASTGWKATPHMRKYVPYPAITPKRRDRLTQLFTDAASSGTAMQPTCSGVAR